MMGRCWQDETEVLVDGDVLVHFVQHKSYTDLLVIEAEPTRW